MMIPYLSLVLIEDKTEEDPEQKIFRLKKNFRLDFDEIGSYQIGRLSTCNPRLNVHRLSGVSRQQCIIRIVSVDEIRLYDGDGRSPSTYGTTVNGIRYYCSPDNAEECNGTRFFDKGSIGMGLLTFQARMQGIKSDSFDPWRTGGMSI
ncbi:MAG: FHA domain-containing protein [Symploca sp. SIO2D2]|nr:FHA domain-containing protein [Symploca sp. SIO2D2]